MVGFRRRCKWGAEEGAEVEHPKGEFSVKNLHAA